MERLIYKSLLAWKGSQGKKPLVLYGARRVGKTYILKEFGKREYKNTLYLNFGTDKKLHGYFADDISPKYIIISLKAIFKQDINEETLLIFDEVQECQRAIDSLKFFSEYASEYHVAATGSFLETASEKFPAGQVNKLRLYPMLFSEFLEATGNEFLLKNMPNMHSLAVEKLKQYFYTGGMPEAVETFAKTEDLALTRQVQENILSSYKEDFSTRVKGSDIPKVRMLWNSIPIHLAKGKKKFMYKELKQGGRATEFENALNWLVNAGLVYKVPKTSEASIPLSAHEDQNSFKLYMLDTGLLAAAAKLDIKTFFSSEHNVFKEFNGAIAEQFAVQELKPKNLPLCYWLNSTGKAEMDFVVQHEGKIIPIEIKNEENTKAKSLAVYMNKYKPGAAIKSSLQKYAKTENLLSIPLYMLGDFFKGE
jgi:predicted AAA+ superfamily ATPase